MQSKHTGVVVIVDSASGAPFAIFGSRVVVSRVKYPGMAYPAVGPTFSYSSSSTRKLVVYLVPGKRVTILFCRLHN